MSETKRQLRAEAVERLRNATFEDCDNLARVMLGDDYPNWVNYDTVSFRKTIAGRIADLLTDGPDDDSAPEKVVSGGTVDVTTESCDSREKLEEDVLSESASWLHTPYGFRKVRNWLDRQAAITAREVKERVDFSLITQTANTMFTDYQEQVDKLQAKVDELTRQLEQSRKLIGDMLDAADAIRLLGGSYGD